MNTTTEQEASKIVDSMADTDQVTASLFAQLGDRLSWLKRTAYVAALERQQQRRREKLSNLERRVSSLEARAAKALAASFQVGDRVEVRGQCGENAHLHAGQSGTVCEILDAAGHYDVQLDSQPGQPVRVGTVNLKIWKDKSKGLEALWEADISDDLEALCEA